MHVLLTMLASNTLAFRFRSYCTCTSQWHYNTSSSCRFLMLKAQTVKCSSTIKASVVSMSTHTQIEIGFSRKEKEINLQCCHRFSSYTFPWIYRIMRIIVGVQIAWLLSIHQICQRYGFKCVFRTSFFSASVRIFGSIQLICLISITNYGGEEQRLPLLMGIVTRNWSKIDLISMSQGRNHRDDWHPNGFKYHPMIVNNEQRNWHAHDEPYTIILYAYRETF